MKNIIFVFDTNLAGKHGKGLALTALREHGAIYGQGYGLQGKSFGIPTKDQDLKLLPIYKIKDYINGFIKFAKLNPDLKFQVTRVGVGLVGYEDQDMAPLFKEAPDNCILPAGWRNIS